MLFAAHFGSQSYEVFQMGRFSSLGSIPDVRLSNLGKMIPAVYKKSISI